ncbi:putative tetratricopeptide repeat domain protein [Botrytis fragariae]|uniref:Putative tetratricopeptide repeat domain protein n=1 Tax=Botrytis fragariae TaxID=1964551 RepID=A0A8H6ENY8_9HELO|nr:putative tetratricopeptide repeat domain protein [Botrytis fragariae]KAF5879212.1 putative tetratricopeptide repeat domain protein [Botrytis fragariae]
MSELAALTEVFCGENPIVDIVAVHGLNGDSVKTWTSKTNNKFWLGDADMLPLAMKQSRILTFRYNACHHSAFWENFSGSNPSSCSDVDSRALVYSFSRTSKAVEHLHSIFVSTYGILFMGTPHNGSSLTSLASMSRRMLEALLPSKVVSTDGQLLDALKEGSETLQNITDMFIPLMKQFRIYFFWEQQKTDFGTKLDYVVESSSAAPILDSIERAGLPYDHSNMCKFASRTAGGYTIVVAALIRYSKDAPKTIARRWDNAAVMFMSARKNEAAELCS